MGLFAFHPLNGKQKIAEPLRSLRLCGELLLKIFNPSINNVFSLIQYSSIPIGAKPLIL